ncbi:unnamed protein product, partial [Prorocentrum cordatum]
MAFSWGEEDRVEEMFDGLPEEDKEVVMSLHDQFVDGSGQADGQRSLDGVMRTNGYRTGDGFVLLTLLSRFNHSCSPNCEHSFDGDLSEMHVYASTDIAAGEELRTYWMELAAPTDERLALLREELGFTCRCPACVRSGAAAAASDGRRRRLRYLQECLEDLRVEGADADVERGLTLSERCSTCATRRASTRRHFGCRRTSTRTTCTPCWATASTPRRPVERRAASARCAGGPSTRTRGCFGPCAPTELLGHEREAVNRASLASAEKKEGAVCGSTVIR